MFRSAFAALVFVAVFAAALAARADDWAGPQVHEVFSPSRDHFVRVTPGESLGDTFGFKGEKTGRYATAEFFKRAADGSYEPTATVALLNPIAPVEFLVSNDGRLATIDNWHNRGYGTVVAIYAADGSVVKSYKLADLFSAEEIEAFSHSMSSIHWHDAPAYINTDQKTLFLMITSGSSMVFGFETGAYAYCETRDGKYQCRDTKAERKWRPYNGEPKR